MMSARGIEGLAVPRRVRVLGEQNDSVRVPDVFDPFAEEGNVGQHTSIRLLRGPRPVDAAAAR